MVPTASRLLGGGPWTSLIAVWVLLRKGYGGEATSIHVSTREMALGLWSKQD